LKDRWPLIALLLVSLAIRLAWGLSRPAELGADLPDQREYLAIAENALHGRGFVFRDERFGDDVYAFRSPGYPALVAMCGASPRVVRMAQAVIDTSTVLAIYLLARHWLDRQASLVAAGFVAFNPFLIFFSGLLLTETLFTAVLAWGLALISWPKVTRRADAIHVLGLLPLAAAVITRPASAVLVPVACLLAGKFDRTLVPRVLAGLAIVCVTLLPWAARNHLVLGRWIFTTTNTGQTQYDGFRAGAEGASHLEELTTMPELRGKNEVERNDYLAARGRELAMADVQRSLRLAVLKVGRTWSPVPLSDEYASPRNTIIGLAYAVPLFMLTLVGLFRRGLPRPAKALCLLPAVYFTATVAISVGSLRYRIPAEPPMAVLAASVFVRRSTHGA